MVPGGLSSNRNCSLNFLEDVSRVHKTLTRHLSYLSLLRRHCKLLTLTPGAEAIQVLMISPQPKLRRPCSSSLSTTFAFPAPEPFPPQRRTPPGQPQPFPRAASAVSESTLSSSSSYQCLDSMDYGSCGCYVDMALFGCFCLCCLCC